MSSRVSANEGVKLILSRKRFAMVLMFWVICFGFASGSVLADSGDSARAAGRVDPNQHQKRIALVLGNGAYTSISTLDNPLNDARAMAKALRALGFEVIDAYDQKLSGMLAAVQRFEAALTADAVGLFYYAGHGVGIQGANYLLPIEADVNSPQSVKYESVNVNMILEVMESANNGINIILLDACRNNPFKTGSRNIAGGLFKLEMPRGTFVSFATMAGAVAEDGETEHSTYTRHILQEMMTPDQSIQQMFTKVAEAVKTNTGGEQVPARWDTLSGYFSFLETRSRSEQAVAAILESMEGYARLSVIDQTTLDDAKIRFDQLRVLSPDHPFLSQQSAVLGDLRARLIEALLNRSDLSGVDVAELKQHFTHLALLVPDHPLLARQDTVIEALYLHKIDSAIAGKQLNSAKSLCGSAKEALASVRSVTLKCSVLNEAHEKAPREQETELSAEYKTSIEKQAIRFQHSEMNCAAERFRKIKANFKQAGQNTVLAEEYVKDACSGQDWLYVGVSGSLDQAVRVCRSFQNNWRLFSYEDFKKLLTVERYPGQGGMLDVGFFPQDDSLGPQHSFWTSTRERGRYVIANGVSGQARQTIDKFKTAKVICTRTAS